MISDHGSLQEDDYYESESVGSSGSHASRTQSHTPTHTKSEPVQAAKRPEAEHSKVTPAASLTATHDMLTSALRRACLEDSHAARLIEESVSLISQVFRNLFRVEQMKENRR